MSHNSTRLAIPIADLTDAADVPASLAALVAVIDANAAWISKGTFASRPAAGTAAGKLYYATDTGAFYVTDGTTWQLINPYPGSDLAAGVASLRTLGTGALQAASGTDSRLSDTRTPSALSVVTSTIAAGAVLFSKMGFVNPIALQKVSQNGTGFTTPTANAKAGRVLLPVDFSTLLGMSIPRILVAANGTVTDTSGSGNTITNTGSVNASGADSSGIDGTAGTAFNMDGSTMFLTAPNSMKQRYGTWGCWMQTPQRVLPSPADQALIAMWQAASADVSFRLMIEGTTGLLRAEISTNGGTGGIGAKTWSSTVVADGAWHFVAMSWDGAKLCVYVDGVLEGMDNIPLATNNAVGQGPLNLSAALLFGIGAYGNGANKFEGKLSNVYAIDSVLDETAHRSLYAKKYAHGLGTQPELYVLNVRKYFRSKTYVAADFTGMTSLGTGISQPLIGSNFESTTYVNDFGTIGGFSSTITDATGPYPWQGNALGGGGFPGSFFLNGASTFAISGSDTGLPSGASPNVSYGIWFRCNQPTVGNQFLMEYGTAAGNAGRGCWIDSSGTLWAGQSGALTTGAVSVAGVCDGQWHYVVVVERNTGVSLRKMYLDGQLVSVGTAALGTITLGGAVAFKVGNNIAQTAGLVGFMGGFHLGTSVLIAENVRELYNKVNTSKILADRQPMDPSNFVERADSTNIYWIGDDLEPTDYVELYAA